MESDKQHVRHILLFFYRKGIHPVQARKKLIDVYGEGVLTLRQTQNWFAQFRSGNFDIEDAPRSGRPVEADKDAIKALVGAKGLKKTKTKAVNLCLKNMKQKVAKMDKQFIEHKNKPKCIPEPKKPELKKLTKDKSKVTKKEVASTSDQIVKMDIKPTTPAELV